MQVRNVALVVASVILLGSIPLAHAIDYEFGDTQFKFKNRYTVGSAWRTQERSNGLIGKLNVPGQQQLCATDNCISFTGDPGPNARLVNAAGAFSGVNQDDGNINYDRYDMVAGVSKLSSDLIVEHGEWLMRLRAIGYYDAVNADFNTRHFNTNYQPDKTKRADGPVGAYARGVQLYDAFLQYNTEVAGHTTVISVGQQTIRWGESNLVALNSISEINPPNSNFLHMPGGEINEIFQPVPAALISADLFEGVSADLLYQFGWKAVQPDAATSFFSESDIAGRGKYAVIGLGQFGEDPTQKFRLAGALGLISSTSVTVYPETRKPSSQGQFGLRVNYNAESLFNGVEFGFYGLNYHSRLPYVSVISANESCARDATGGADALTRCNGFNGTLPRAPGQVGKEPLPIDTLRLLLEYPENIQMLGASFNTTVGKFSISGEYSFRPNLPLQVQSPDVIYAGLQPAFPTNDIRTDPTGIANALTGAGIQPSLLPAAQAAALAELGASTLPSATHSIPSYLAAYRNLGRIAPNQYIAGYQRFPVGQFDITAIRAWSSNPFGADQIILLTEAGFTQIYGLPSRSVLQIEGGSANNTHAGAGADGTGLTAANSCRSGQADAADPNNPKNYTCKLSPTQQTSGFADSFSWGIRTLARMEYNNMIFGWSLKPTFGFNWDINGTAPFPQQNFVQGRQEFLAGTEVVITPSFSSNLFYTAYTGGKRGENTRADRDYVSFSLAYTF